MSADDYFTPDWREVTPTPAVERNTGWRQTTVTWLQTNYPAYLAGTGRMTGARLKLNTALAAMSYMGAERAHENETRAPGYAGPYKTEDPHAARERVAAGWDQPDHDAMVKWLAEGGHKGHLERLRAKTKAKPAWPFSPDSDPGISEADEPDDLIASHTLEEMIEEDPGKFRKSFDKLAAMPQPRTPEQELQDLEDSLINPAAGSW